MWVPRPRPFVARMLTIHRRGPTVGAITVPAWQVERQSPARPQCQRAAHGLRVAIRLSAPPSAFRALAAAPSAPSPPTAAATPPATVTGHPTSEASNSSSHFFMRVVVLIRSPDRGRRRADWGDIYPALVLLSSPGARRPAWHPAGPAGLCV